MQKSETSKIATFSIAFGMRGLALVKGLFKDQVTVIQENVIFNLQLPALSTS